MLQFRPAFSLEGREQDWLKAKYHFAVSDKGNQANGPLGALIVWNDDEIAPGKGFGFHRHADMEIITYVRQGAVTHEDNLGNRGQTFAGDVQVMSAGIGISHAERNEGTEPLKLFQIWIRPRSLGGTPRWNTRKFPKADRAGELVLLASGLQGDTDALSINANARVVGATLTKSQRVEYVLEPGRFAYLAPTKGRAVVNGLSVSTGDGLAASNERTLLIEAAEDTEFVLVDAA